MATLTQTVDAYVNQAPSAVGDNTLNTAYNTTKVYTRAEFTTTTTPPYADPEGDAALNLKVLSLPADGTLKLNAVDVLVNDIISFADIDAGLFTYVPDGAIVTAQSVSFTFSIADAGSGIFVS